MEAEVSKGAKRQTDRGWGREVERKREAETDRQRKRDREQETDRETER